MQPTFDVAFADLGAGVANLVPTVGGVVATFTRAGGATTIDRNGKVISVATGVPRSAYEPESLLYHGLLLEPGRQNLTLQNTDLSTVDWTKGNAQVVQVAEAAPDGAAQSSAFTEAALNTSHQVFNTIGPAVTANFVYTNSLWIKANGRRYGDIGWVIGGSTSGVRASFDLLNGTISAPLAIGAGTATASSIKRYPNGWFRVSVSGKLDAATITGYQILEIFESPGVPIYLGEVGKGFYVWGSQLEVGASPTSLIYTTVAAVIRAADTLTYPTTGWLNALAGTMFADVGLAAPFQNNERIAVIEPSGDTANRLFDMFYDTSNVVNWFGSRLGAAQFSIAAGSPSSRIPVKAAGAYAANSANIAVNGVLGLLDTVATLPTGAFVLQVGHLDAASHLNGVIKSLKYFNTRLPDNVLKFLSAGGVHINDAINAAIPDVGAANQIEDKLLRFYQSNGATSGQIDDAERQFLLANGAGVTLGAEQITDPTFLNTANWTEGLGWSVGFPGALINGNNVANSIISSTTPFVGVGRDQVEVTISNYVSGSLQLGIGAFRGEVVFGNGVHQFIADLAGRNGVPLLEAAPFSQMLVDKFSVRSIQASDNINFQLNDMWEYYFRVVKGYTGSLDDMEMEYWTVGPRP
jgi:hypothetical protein